MRHAIHNNRPSVDSVISDERASRCDDLEGRSSGEEKHEASKSYCVCDVAMAMRRLRKHLRD